MTLRAVPDWLQRHPVVGDVIWAVCFAPFVIPGCMEMSAKDGPGDVVGILIGLVVLGSMLWRRRTPEVFAVVLACAELLHLLWTDTISPLDVAMAPALYALAAYSRRRWYRVWLALGLLAAGVASYDWTFHGTNSATAPYAVQWLFQSLFLGAFVVAFWVMGELARQRRNTLAALRERAAGLERERDQHSRLAAQEERARIAREMHDIVAHNLSVIVVQADGGAYIAGQAGGDPEKRAAAASAALQTIAATAREALSETRRLVGVLRASEPDREAAEYTPSATLAQIGELVERMRQAGVPASYELVGSPQAHPPLSPGAEMAAYRVVQESLTNAVKHAGPGASVAVRLEHSPDGLAIAIRDDGHGSGGGADSDGQGHGLIGMRERVATYGGTLFARDRMSGGYEVLAHIPAHDPGQPPQDRPSEGR